MWSNLRKGQDMDTGTIGFFNNIEKTKVEANPDFKKEREERDAKELREKKKLFKEQKIREREEDEANKRLKHEQSYEYLIFL